MQTFFKRELRRWGGINGAVTRRRYLTGFITANQHHPQAGVILYRVLYLHIIASLYGINAVRLSAYFLGYFIGLDVKLFNQLTVLKTKCNNMLVWNLREKTNLATTLLLHL